MRRAGTASTPFVLAPTGLRALRVDPAPLLDAAHQPAATPEKALEEQPTHALDRPRPLRNAVLHRLLTDQPAECGDDRRGAACLSAAGNG